MTINGEYDVVIVGAGVGGSSIASRLCSLGKKVLLLEKGDRLFSENKILDKPILFSSNNIENVVKNVPLVEGLGGNSLIYGGQLSRFDNSCFESNVDQATTFPFKYSEIEPYYNQLEAIFSGAKPTHNKAEKELVFNFEKCGFESLSSTYAVRSLRGCDGCGGKLCKIKCKKDFYSELCNEFVKSGLLTTVCGVNIKKINIIKRKVKSISYDLKGAECEIRTSALVLSAGALRTPELIKKHLSGSITNELKNKIGKGLAFHVSDFYLLYPKFLTTGSTSTAKILNGRLNFLSSENSNLKHTIQSVGAPIKTEYIERFILRRLPGQMAQNPLIQRLIKSFSRVAEWTGSKAHVVATIIQDPMLEENKVDENINSQNIKVSYSISADFNVAIKKIDKQIRNALKKKFFVVGLGGLGNINYGHPMGGCAMGHAAIFPVNKHGRLKELKNVYIADSSVFPVSGDTNPSLTIAAVAFRTADQLLTEI